MFFECKGYISIKLKKNQIKLIYTDFKYKAKLLDLKNFLYNYHGETSKTYQMNDTQLI